VRDVVEPELPTLTKQEKAQSVTGSIK